MTTSLAGELDKLLAEGIDRAAERQRTEFDRRTAAAGGNIILFGAGNMGRTIARKLPSVGVQPVAFADNNAKLWGQNVEGLPVLSPADAAARYGSSAAFVIAIWGVGSTDRMAARERRLKELGCRYVTPFVSLFWKYPELFLPYHVIDQPVKVLQDAAAVRAVFDLWADEFSRREYLGQIQWRLRGDFDAMADPVAQTTYFPEDLFALTDKEVFVDCGAFDGDTVRGFLQATGSQFDRVIAFEPDPANYAKLSRSIDALPADTSRKIETHRKATGSADGTVSFSALGTDGSSIGEGDVQVDCVALDTALHDVFPSHIKMDIEGAEPDALEGACQTIARKRPILAICSYHFQPHVWQLPALIRSMNADYRFFLRPHLMEGWDAVCYAVPTERSKL